MTRRRDSMTCAPSAPRLPFRNAFHRARRDAVVVRRRGVNNDDVDFGVDRADLDHPYDECPDRDVQMAVDVAALDDQRPRGWQRRAHEAGQRSELLAEPPDREPL